MRAVCRKRQGFPGKMPNGSCLSVWFAAWLPVSLVSVLRGLEMGIRGLMRVGTKEGCWGGRTYISAQFFTLMCKVLGCRYKYTDTNTNTERVPSREIKIKGKHKQANYSKCHYNYIASIYTAEGAKIVSVYWKMHRLLPQDMDSNGGSICEFSSVYNLY